MGAKDDEDAGSTRRRKVALRLVPPAATADAPVHRSKRPSGMELTDVTFTPAELEEYSKLYRETLRDEAERHSQQQQPQPPQPPQPDRPPGTARPALASDARLQIAIVLLSAALGLLAIVFAWQRLFGVPEPVSPPRIHSFPTEQPIVPIAPSIEPPPTKQSEPSPPSVFERPLPLPAAKPKFNAPRAQPSASAERAPASPPRKKRPLYAPKRAVEGQE